MSEWNKTNDNWWYLKAGYAWANVYPSGRWNIFHDGNCKATGTASCREDALAPAEAELEKWRLVPRTGGA